MITAVPWVLAPADGDVERSQRGDVLGSALAGSVEVPGMVGGLECLALSVGEIAERTLRKRLDPLDRAVEFAFRGLN